MLCNKIWPSYRYYSTLITLYLTNPPAEGSLQLKGFPISSILAQGLVILSNVKVDLRVINISWVFLNNGSVQELNLLPNTVDVYSGLSLHTRLMILVNIAIKSDTDLTIQDLGKN
jgi:hypothetical protein